MPAAQRYRRDWSSQLIKGLDRSGREPHELRDMRRNSQANSTRESAGDPVTPISQGKFRYAM
jgi:hypothetical protein